MEITSENEDKVAESKKKKELSKDQKTTLARLKELPTKKLLIPEDPLNPDDVVVPICVNGVIYSVPRGVEVDVPEVIFDIWRESYQKTAAANKRITMTEDRKLEIN